MTNSQMTAYIMAVADFMEERYTLLETAQYVVAHPHIMDKGHGGFKALRYNESWEQLMQVVEKIEALHDNHHGKFAVYIHSNVCNIQGTNLWKSLAPGSQYGSVYLSDPNAIFLTKKESVWCNVVQFIKWYNDVIKKDN